MDEYFYYLKHFEQRSRKPKDTHKLTKQQNEADIIPYLPSFTSYSSYICENVLNIVGRVPRVAFGWHDNPLPKWKYAIRLKWIEYDQHRQQYGSLNEWLKRWRERVGWKGKFTHQFNVYSLILHGSHITRFVRNSFNRVTKTYICSVFSVRDTQMTHTETMQPNISKRHFRSFVRPPFDDYAHSVAQFSINRTLMITFFLFPSYRRILNEHFSTCNV